MTNDARFEDAREAALNLGALDVDDLQIISSLAQDSVFPATEMTWRPGARRFALLLNRFRWEEGAASHAPERVQALLVIDCVLRVATQGIDRTDKDLILSLLSITFEPGEDGSGHLLLTLAGDGAIRLEVEALEVTLKDVTRPYIAPSGKTPRHPDQT
ncbi:DUF2948 family protein [Roseovarius dicentrarchi]|uniref:DUF2948 family protein n=1 Tax=Roseovarius dicentrarchi TaxID=2250573 RepID=UPI000DE8FF52|nr:DUF2948 family protein [Roseovarius dicentrarchi]